MNNNGSQGMTGGQQPQQFSPQHHQVYDFLRQALMHLHQQGVPGMDKVLNALNMTHVGLTKPQPQPVNPYMRQMVDHTSMQNQSPQQAIQQSGMAGPNQRPMQPQPLNSYTPPQQNQSMGQNMGSYLGQIQQMGKGGY